MEAEAPDQAKQSPPLPFPYLITAEAPASPARGSPPRSRCSGRGRRWTRGPTRARTRSTRSARGARWSQVRGGQRERLWPAAKPAAAGGAVAGRGLCSRLVCRRRPTFLRPAPQGWRWTWPPRMSPTPRASGPALPSAQRWTERCAARRSTARRSIAKETGERAGGRAGGPLHAHRCGTGSRGGHT